MFSPDGYITRHRRRQVHWPRLEPDLVTFHEIFEFIPNLIRAAIIFHQLEYANIFAGKKTTNWCKSLIYSAANPCRVLSVCGWWRKGENGGFVRHVERVYANEERVLVMEETLNIRMNHHFTFYHATSSKQQTRKRRKKTEGNFKRPNSCTRGSIKTEIFYDLSMAIKLMIARWLERESFFFLFRIELFASSWYVLMRLFAAASPFSLNWISATR